MNRQLPRLKNRCQFCAKGIRVKLSIVQTFCVLVILLAGGCARAPEQQFGTYFEKTKSAVRGIVPANEPIEWQMIDVDNKNEKFVNIGGRFIARLRRHSTRIPHRVFASFNPDSKQLVSISIDGIFYQLDADRSVWWDGIEDEPDPEEKFSHLTDEEKNALWWEINRRVGRDRKVGSTTITWPMHDLIKLTSRYNVSPQQLTEFFEYGRSAKWRTEKPPNDSTDK